MSILLPSLVRTALAIEDEESLLTIVPGNTSVIPESSGVFDQPFSSDLGFEMEPLPTGEEFVERLECLLADRAPSRLLLLPHSRSLRDVPESLASLYPGLELNDIALLTALRTMVSGGRVEALVPDSWLTCSRSGGRAQAQALARLSFVIQQLRLPGLHREFALASVVFEIGARDQPVKFFRCPPPETVGDDEVLSDLRRLARQQGGETKFGYVLREGIESDTRWSFDWHSPQTARAKEELARFGGTRTLEHLVDLIPGVHRTKDANRLSKGTDSPDVPLITGKNILGDGTLDFDDVGHRVRAEPREILRPGDVLLRTIVAPTTERLLHLAIVQPGDPPFAVDSTSVLAFRPKESLEAEEVRFLLSYLRSSRANTLAHALRASAVIRFTVRDLFTIPVPALDEPLRLALRGLTEAAESFAYWKAEAEQAMDSVFTLSSSQEVRDRILEVGRNSRLRTTAAQLVDHLHYRIRTRFPHPIAFRWRTVEAARPDLEGYLAVLECGETAACYLAVLAVLAAKSKGESVAWVGEMAKRMSSKSPRGTNAGDWVAILQEVGQSRAFRNLGPAAPFAEVVALKSDDVAWGALSDLIGWRNDQAHQRGPKGARVATAFEAARARLEEFLSRVEFLAEYPLRQVEATRWDSLKGHLAYSFRDLMGDHSLVPLERATAPTATLEAESLYVVDRAGALHLARPFLLRRECPVCETSATFFLDTYRPKEDLAVLKSLEHGHTIEDSELPEALRAVGLLRDPS